ncbi:hypothetical protein BT69DRAFT_1283208 [Atractiella rhizophila]|nr:hypothetical protein BT69DRAFT_1283208 [Atractiella rhizophila]
MIRLKQGNLLQIERNKTQEIPTANSNIEGNESDQIQIKVQQLNVITFYEAPRTKKTTSHPLPPKLPLDPLKNDGLLFILLGTGMLVFVEAVTAAVDFQSVTLSADRSLSLSKSSKRIILTSLRLDIESFGFNDSPALLPARFSSGIEGKLSLARCTHAFIEGEEELTSEGRLGMRQRLD